MQIVLLNLLKNSKKCLDTSLSNRDQSKALNALRHGLLFAKLAAYGLDKVAALSLITDYLTNRLQRVKIGSTFSPHFEIFRGIPQGSISGPILLNSFISYLMFFINET